MDDASTVLPELGVDKELFTLDHALSKHLRDCFTNKRLIAIVASTIDVPVACSESSFNRPTNILALVRSETCDTPSA